ncbi:hypothetical protein P8452_38197 [Trifolium repens]|nr:hypothetical protein P8452_38197 [Trifolium repens]
MQTEARKSESLLHLLPLPRAPPLRNNINNTTKFIISILSHLDPMQNSEARSTKASISGHEDILNPDIVRSKGCSAFSNETPSMHRAPRSCGICCIVGHNKRSCPQTNVNYVSGNTQSPMPTIKATNGSEYSFDLNN